MTSAITGKYCGDLRVQLRHEDSGVEITTAAPKDNNGDGSSFSPTDLTCASLAACMLTIMGMVAKRDGVPLEGTTFTVAKGMTAAPRKIGSIVITFTFPQRLDESYLDKLRTAAFTCPVHRSLKEDVAVEVKFV